MRLSEFRKSLLCIRSEIPDATIKVLLVTLQSGSLTGALGPLLDGPLITVKWPVPERACVG